MKITSPPPKMENWWIWLAKSNKTTFLIFYFCSDNLSSIWCGFFSPSFSLMEFFIVIQFLVSRNRIYVVWKVMRKERCSIVMPQKSITAKIVMKGAVAAFCAIAIACSLFCLLWIHCRIICRYWWEFLFPKLKFYKKLKVFLPIFFIPPALWLLRRIDWKVIKVLKLKIFKRYFYEKFKKYVFSFSSFFDW